MPGPINPIYRPNDTNVHVRKSKQPCAAPLKFDGQHRISLVLISCRQTERGMIPFLRYRCNSPFPEIPLIKPRGRQRLFRGKKIPIPRRHLTRSKSNPPAFALSHLIYYLFKIAGKWQWTKKKCAFFKQSFHFYDFASNSHLFPFPLHLYFPLFLLLFFFLFAVSILQDFYSQTRQTPDTFFSLSRKKGYFLSKICP